MKVKAITPIRVTDVELARRRERYRRLSPPQLELDLVNLPDAATTPRQLDSAGVIALSDRLVAAEALRTDPARYDVVLPDCVLDPAVDRVADPPVPIVGILKLSASYLASIGHRFGAVTRNQPIGDELVARVEEYGLVRWFDRLEVLDLAFDAVSDDAAWHAALDTARKRFADDGGAVINGCSAVELPAGDGSAVVDPTRLALSLLGVAAATGVAPGTAVPAAVSERGGR